MQKEGSYSWEDGTVFNVIFWVEAKLVCGLFYRSEGDEEGVS